MADRDGSQTISPKELGDALKQSFEGVHKSSEALTKRVKAIEDWLGGPPPGGGPTGPSLLQIRKDVDEVKLGLSSMDRRIVALHDEQDERLLTIQKQLEDILMRLERLEGGGGLGERLQRSAI